MTAAAHDASAHDDRPPAVVSVDVDPVDLHLVGYGHSGLAADPLVYTRALPRLLDLFARCGIRATLFCVGRDAATHGAAIGAAARAGHEIASHTWSHPIRFARLPAARHRAELADSKRALEQASGTPVVGFRAPNFDMDARLVPRLVAAGYRYDASAYPSPLLLPARAVLALKSRDRMSVLRMRPWPFTWRREPYRWQAGGAELMEFPVSVTPGWRFPVYHTLIYYRGMRRLTADLDGFARRREMLGYTLHTVDALGVAEDGVDARLAPHPGMNKPLAEKLALLESALRAIAARFHSVAYRDLLDAPVPDPSTFPPETSWFDVEGDDVAAIPPGAASPVVAFFPPRVVTSGWVRRNGAPISREEALRRIAAAKSR